MSDKYDTRERLVAEAASWRAIQHHENARLPAAIVDAQAEYHDEWLLARARQYVAAHADVKLPAYMETAA